MGLESYSNPSKAIQSYSKLLNSFRWVWKAFGTSVHFEIKVFWVNVKSLKVFLYHSPISVPTSWEPHQRLATCFEAWWETVELEFAWDQWLHSQMWTGQYLINKEDCKFPSIFGFLLSSEPTIESPFKLFNEEFIDSLIRLDVFFFQPRLKKWL